MRSLLLARTGEKSVQMFETVISALNEGFVQTLKLFFITLVGSIPLGLIICFGSMNRWAPLGAPGRRKLAYKQRLSRKVEDGVALCRADMRESLAARAARGSTPGRC